MITATDEIRATTRVLVVEDERLIAADLQQLIAELGYNGYATACSGDEALTVARETPPDIVLADVRIDGPLDGVDTAMQLRRLYRTSAIFLTAHADDATVYRAASAQPSGYLVKPVSVPALKAALKVCVDARRREGRARRRQLALEQMRLRLAYALHQVPHAVQLEDEQGKIVYLNQAFCSMFGLTQRPRSLYGADGTILMEHIGALCAEPNEFGEIIKCLRRTQQPTADEFLGLTDGRTLERDYYPVFDGPTHVGHLWLYHDVTERERERLIAAQKAERARFEAMVDELTGLTSRRGFYDLAKTYLLAGLTGSQKKVLFFIDLNGLKAINDRWGHVVGDEALREMAQVLKDSVRASDLVARLGGDEFVVLASVPANGIESFKARLRVGLQELNDKGSRPYRLEASIGAAEYARGDSLDALVSRADQAMYLEKRTTAGSKRSSSS